MSSYTAPGTDPLRILARGLARSVPEWDFVQLEHRGARHPLVRSGLLACVRTAERYDCPCGNCDARPRLFTRTDGHVAYVCALTGATIDIADTDEVRLWRYEPERMAELLRGLLACPETRETDANTWCLGPSAFPALDGRLVYVQTRAAEASLHRARNAAPNAPFVLLAGRADTLTPDSPLRPATFTFEQVLALAPDGAATLRPRAFAATAAPAHTDLLVDGFTPAARKQLLDLLQSKPAEKSFFTDRNLSLLFGISTNTVYNWRKGKCRAPAGFHDAFAANDSDALKKCAEKYRANRAKCDVMNSRHVVHDLSDKTLARALRAGRPSRQ